MDRDPERVHRRPGDVLIGRGRQVGVLLLNRHRVFNRAIPDIVARVDPDRLARGPIQRWITFVFDKGVVAVVHLLDDHVDRGQIPGKELPRRLSNGFQIFRGDIQGPLAGPIGFGQVRCAEVMRRVPGEEVLRTRWVVK